MAVVLGPELDVYLRGIGDELKGKTKVNYVDQETIIHACAAQNKVILLLQEQMLKSQEIERSMQRNLSELQDKVSYFEKYTKKVDSIEDVLMEKIPLVDKMNEVMKEHNIVIERHETEFREHITQFDTFRDNIETKISQTTQDLTKVQTQIKVLPKTIVISSRQVTHSLEDEGSITKPAPDGKELLADVIAQQEQHAYLQDESIKTTGRRLEEHVAQQEERNEKNDIEMRDIIDWKTEQSSVDLVEMKVNQDSMLNKLESHTDALSRKMSKQDVNKKLDVQFKDIVDHLQSALSSVEKDEGDFKTITDTLSQMCKTLRESKADKSEIKALREQFIQNQIHMEDDNIGTSLNGSSLDNESIRKILKDYPTKTEVERSMNSKLDGRKAIPEFLRINDLLQSLQGTVRKLADSSFADEAFGDQYDFPISDQGGLFSLNDLDEIDTIEEESSASELHPSSQETPSAEIGVDLFESYQNSEPSDNNINDPKHRNKHEAKFDPDAMRKAKRKSRARNKNRSRKRGGDPVFPSSNMMNGSLRDIPPNEEALEKYQKNKTIDNTGEYLKTVPIRPATAPAHRNTSEQVIQKPLTKKKSLPAILTTISKSIKPRSKSKLKKHFMKRGKNASKTIHNGSFQVLPSSSSQHDDFDSSFQYTVSPSLDNIPVDGQTSRPRSSEQRRRPIDTVIRTSIA